MRGSGVAISSYNAGSVGFDGLFVIKPDGRMYIQTGVGNLGTESWSDCQRVAAEMMGMPWEKVEISLGRHVEEPAVELRVGRQPDDSRAHARGARLGDRRHQEAAADCGEGSWRPARGLRRGQRACRAQGRRGAA